MKTTHLTFLLLALGFAAQAQASVCTLVFVNTHKGQNVTFTPATKQADTEYRTFEEASLGKTEFLLKAGHGVTRVEAWTGGKLKATAWNHGEGSINLEIGSG